MADIMDEIIKKIDTPLRQRSREIVVNISRYGLVAGKRLSSELIAKETGMKLIDVKRVLVGEPASEGNYKEIEQYVLRKLEETKRVNE